MWTQKMPLSGLTVALTFEKFCPRPEYKPLLVLTLIGKSWKTHPEYFPKFQFTGLDSRLLIHAVLPENSSKDGPKLKVRKNG